MFALNSGDKIRGDASVASKVDYLIHGAVGIVHTQLANGQLSDSIGDLYTAAAAVGVGSLTLVNTHTVAITVNIYLTPSGGTARRMIPKDLSLQPGYALIFDGQKMTIHDTNGGLVLGSSVSDLVYSAGWDGVTTVAPSKNVVYDALLQTLLTAQGDTVYASAANVLARLAKGTADTKLFMKADGTIPEWAAGIFCKNETRDMTAVGAPTDVSYTGYGFKPSLLIFFVGLDNTYAMSVGIGTPALTEFCVVTNRQNAGAGIIEPINGYCIMIYQGAAVSYQAASLKTLDADGFTLTWSKLGTPAAGTAQIYVVAIR